jgi:DNA-binding transcriptional MerR regulator
MSLAEKEITKLYYTIGEVAEMFEVNTSLIRFWEKEFSVLKPKKNKKGNRLFTAKDIENIRRIYQLVKEQGYTLEGAKAQLKGGKAELSENQEIIDRLKGIRKELLKIHDNL